MRHAHRIPRHMHQRQKNDITTVREALYTHLCVWPRRSSSTTSVTKKQGDKRTIPKQRLPSIRFFCVCVRALLIYRPATSAGSSINKVIAFFAALCLAADGQAPGILPRGACMRCPAMIIRAATDRFVYHSSSIYNNKKLYY